MLFIFMATRSTSKTRKGASGSLILGGSLEGSAASRGRELLTGGSHAAEPPSPPGSGAVLLRRVARTSRRRRERGHRATEHRLYKITRPIVVVAVQLR